MAAPVIESFSQASPGNTNSITIDKPAGTASGEKLVAVLCKATWGVTSTDPTGLWTEEVDHVHISGFSGAGISVYSMVAGGAEPSSYTFNYSGSNNNVGAIFRVSGAGAVRVASANSGGIDRAPISPSISALADDLLVSAFAFGQPNGLPATVPSGMSLQWSLAGGAGIVGVAASEAVVGDGATGTRTWATNPGGNTSRWAAASIAIAPASGGGTDVTGTLAATETGADAASFTGTVAVQGALAATETGSDTFAATGTVAAPGITGTLAATESGADTASFAGGVLVSGALSATETGSDVAAIAGIISVSGALAATEAGSDAFAATGSVLVSGAMSAQEAGNDNFAGSGSVLVSGSLAAVESGADTFAATGTVADAGGPVAGTLAAVETGSDTAAFTGEIEGAVRRGGFMPRRPRRVIPIEELFAVRDIFRSEDEPERPTPPTRKKIKAVEHRVVNAVIDPYQPSAVRTEVRAFVSREVRASVQPGLSWHELHVIFERIMHEAAERAAEIEREIEDEDEMILLLAA